MSYPEIAETSSVETIEHTICESPAIELGLSTWKISNRESRSKQRIKPGFKLGLSAFETISLACDGLG